jgi:Putative adhesin
MRKSTPVAAQIAGFVTAALALAACDITIGAAEFSVREEKTFAVSGRAQLALSTFDGSIQVRGWDRNEVLVEVEKVGPDQQTVDRIHVNATQDGGAITIDVPKPSPLATTGLRRTPGANLVVSVPFNAAVVARSGDGSIEVRRVNGKLDLDTGDGGVRVEEVAGALVVRTGDGNVSGRKVDGQVEIHTGDGTVGLDGVLTGVRIETRDGAVEVTARPGSRTDSDWDVTSGDGDVHVEVPRGFGAEVDARTGDGRVRIESITDTGDAKQDEGEDRDSATGRLGGGGKALRLRTSSGSITVKLW